MKLKEPSQEDNASIVVDLPDRCPHSFFQPYRDATPTPQNSSSAGVDAPEKELTLFAFRLALLEKSASGLGTLAFVWATVVLLGGFAVTLEPKDFVFVTIILVIESTRIFSRSHELQWQHQATGTLAAAGLHSFRTLRSSSRFLLRVLKANTNPFSVSQREERGSGGSGSGRSLERAAATASPASCNGKQQRTWNMPDVPLLPYAGWVFVAKNISRVLSWLQVASALTCVALSLTRLIQQNYGEVSDESKNRNKALDLFYSLALAEAIIFLLEKAYWEWKISCCNVLQTVSKECDLGTSGIVATKRFFYDTYYKCVDGSVFDGLKMDLVAFASELLDSEFHNEQLIGVQILQKFSHNDPFAYGTLRKIGTSTRVIERLIDMLNWKNPDEEEIRKCAAEIVTKLAGKQQNVLRVAGIPGAIDSISSLLHSGRSSNLTPHELNERSNGNNSNPSCDYSTFNLLGLRILKKLATDQDNCGKIGNARGLLPKIIDLTSASRTLLQNDRASFSQIKTVKKSLHLVRILVSTTGNAGKLLRQEISEIVFTVGNIREIIQYGERHMVLQTLGIAILKSLAMDKDAKEIIGRTGGIIKLLLSTFLNPRVVESEKFNLVPVEAGETLAMLALNCRNNCDRILKEPAVLDRLMGALEDVLLQINASRILRNLCAYSRPERAEQLRGITAALPTVLKAVMETKEKLLEASIGLATQICKLMDTKPNEFSKVLEQASIQEADLVEKLVQILNEYSCPEIRVPRMRRFVIQQAIWMMQTNRDSVQLFKRFEMEKLLVSVADTTLELECFHIFSGSVGLDRHSRTLSSIVDIALGLMTD